MRTRTTVLAGILGIALVSGASLAIAAFVSPPSMIRTFQVQHSLGYGGTGPATTLAVHRGTLSNGNYPMQFDLTIQATGVLTSAVLQTSTDSNSNGTLDESEWTTVATATIGQSVGTTIASTGWVNVSSSVDGYRVRYLRSDIGTTLEEWVNNPSKDLP